MKDIPKAYSDKVQSLANHFQKPMSIFWMSGVDTFIWYRDPRTDRKNPNGLQVVKTFTPEEK